MDASVEHERAWSASVVRGRRWCLPPSAKLGRPVGAASKDFEKAGIAREHIRLMTPPHKAAFGARDRAYRRGLPTHANAPLSGFEDVDGPIITAGHVAAPLRASSLR